MSSLLWVDDSRFGEALLFLVFPVICYFHQIVMISVIKYIELLVWLTCTVLMFSVYFLVFKILVRTLRFWLDFHFYLGVSFFLGVDGYCSFCVEVVPHIFLWISFFMSCWYIVYERYLAAKLGTNLVVWIWQVFFLIRNNWDGVFFFFLISAIFIICRWYSFYKNFM